MPGVKEFFHRPCVTPSVFREFPVKDGVVFHGFQKAASRGFQVFAAVVKTLQDGAN